MLKFVTSVTSLFFMMLPAPAVKASLFWNNTAATTTINSRTNTLEFMLMVYHTSPEVNERTQLQMDWTRIMWKSKRGNVFYTQYSRLILLGAFSGSALFKHRFSNGFNCLDNRCFDFLWDKKDVFRFRNLEVECRPTQLELSLKLGSL